MLTWARKFFHRKSACSHVWRPSIHHHAPGKWCVLCGVEVNITEGEFRAQFGRPSYAPLATPEKGQV